MDGVGEASVMEMSPLASWGWGWGLVESFFPLGMLWDWDSGCCWSWRQSAPEEQVCVSAWEIWGRKESLVWVMVKAIVVMVS